MIKRLYVAVNIAFLGFMMTHSSGICASPYLRELTRLEGGLLNQAVFHASRRIYPSRISRRFSSSDGQNTKDPIYILSIDGGGIRGIFPARLLAGIEERLESKYKQPVRLASLFDVIAGTSTGGIIALGLSAPVKTDYKSGDSAYKGYPAKILVDLYAKHGEKVFSSTMPSWWREAKSICGSRYDSAPLERLLDDHFKEIRLAESTTRVIIPSYNLDTSVSGYIFDSKYAGKGTGSYRMKDVARATSAAPTYFPAASIKNQRGDLKTFVDGGIGTNNPTQAAFNAIRKENKTVPIFVVSLGTGDEAKGSLVDLWDRGLADWGSPLGKMATRVDEVDKNVESLLHEGDYIRIQPILHASHRNMDNITRENINHLMGLADNIIDNQGSNSDQHKKFERIIERLEERLTKRGTFPRIDEDRALCASIHIPSTLEEPWPLTDPTKDIPKPKRSWRCYAIAAFIGASLTGGYHLFKEFVGSESVQDDASKINGDGRGLWSLVKTFFFSSSPDESGNLSVSNKTSGGTDGDKSERGVNFRAWKSIREDVPLYGGLSDRPSQASFIESTSEGSEKSYMKLLWEKLHTQNALTTGFSKVALTGMGGLGKSSLATAYAYEALDHKAYDFIYCVPSENEISLMQGYRNLLDLLKGPDASRGLDDDKLIDRVKQEIAAKGPCLLIYDNVSSPDFLKNRIPGEGAHVIITSRCTHGWDHKIELDCFSPRESIKYLLTATNLEENEKNTNDARVLTEELGHLPLALSLAASHVGFMKNGNPEFDLGSYVTKLKNKPDGLWQDFGHPIHGAEKMNHEYFVAKTLEMAKESISSDARKLMTYCAYLVPDLISKDLFLEINKITRLLSTNEEDELDKNFAELCAFSLIKSSKDSYSMHRLIQSVIQQENEENKLSTLSILADLLVQNADFMFNSHLDNNEFKEKTVNVLPHMISVVGYLKKIEINPEKLGILRLVAKILFVSIEDIVVNETLRINSDLSAEKKQRTDISIESIRNKFKILFDESNVMGLESLDSNFENAHPLSQYSISILYQVSKNDQKAFYWCTKAAEQGLARAQFNLGLMYHNGRGVMQSHEEAVKWYAKSAEQGDARAQCNLGWMYDNGYGVEQSDIDAVKWYTRSAEQGNAEAQCNLGIMYGNGDVVEQNYPKAVKWYTRSAEQGFPPAQYNLGCMYAKGRGVEKSHEEEVKWYAKAAEQGDDRAQCSLGRMYAKGKGVEKNYREAIKWYTKAAEQGNIIAQHALGFMYENSQGVEQNYAEAVKWYAKAAEQGDAPAQSDLERLLSQSSAASSSAFEK